jgi:hypothetical protein
MKGILLRVMCAVVLYLPGLQKASAQAYHQLTAAEFQGIPRGTSEDVIAHTHCTIDYHYIANGVDGHYRLNFTIRAIMDRQRSWIKMERVTSQEMLAQILKHEQGHYAICYLEQQELLRVVGQTLFDADYRREAQGILDRIDAKYHQLNIDYDIDTRHMQNHVQQASWNDYFDKKIEHMPPND